MKKLFLLSAFLFCAMFLFIGCVTENVNDPYGYTYETSEDANFAPPDTNDDDENKAPTTYVRVQGFQSGDTLILTNNKVVKLAGISAPRMGEPYYKKSLEYTKLLVGLNLLRLVWVKGTKHSDNVWRANVILKRQTMVLSLNEQLVKIGLAKVTATEPTKFETLNLDKEGKIITLSEKDNRVIFNRLKQFESEAMKKKLNLWSGKYEE